MFLGFEVMGKGYLMIVLGCLTGSKKSAEEQLGLGYFGFAAVVAAVVAAVAAVVAVAVFVAVV